MKKIVICATPRTGSTLLCDLLEKNGVVLRNRNELYEQFHHTNNLAINQDYDWSGKYFLDILTKIFNQKDGFKIMLS